MQYPRVACGVSLHAPVALNIGHDSSNAVRVSWPSPSTGFNLQVHSNLTTSDWVTPAETVTNNGTIKYIIVNPPVSNRFYRLKFH
jgi:hypothetical protein